MNKKKIALHIIVAQVLTILWIYTCPKYIISGEGRTTSVEQRDNRNSWSSTNGVKTSHKQWQPTTSFRHINSGYFWIGVWIIYMGTLSAYLLTDEAKNNESKIQ